MSTELIVCPRCGASPNAPADAHGQYSCVYCGSRFRTQQLVARPVHVSPPAQPPARAPSAPLKKTSPVGVVLAAVGVVTLLGLGGGLAAWRGLSSGASAGAGANSRLDPPATPTSEALLAAPAAAPEVPASATFEAHSHVSGYQSSFYVLGFVKNTSPFSIDKPKVTAVLLDKSGKEVATRDGYAEGDALAPQASAPVKVLVSDPPTHDRIAFEVVAQKASYIPATAPGLRLEILEAPHSTGGSSWEVTGKVFNEGKAGARFVNILVLAFDANARLIGLDSTFADGEAVAAGASARFRAMPLYDAPPRQFKYVVSGQPLK